jgi:choloylglycine hydrolase
MVKQYDQLGNVVNTLNARNMDFEQQIFFNFGFAAAGEQNISDVNFYQGLPNEKVAQWTNIHKFVGRMSFSKEVMIDGINDAGVWAGSLFLPNFTKYPSYDSRDSRPALSVLDTLNFVLGTASSVQDAVQRLQQVQLVNSAAQVTIGGEAKFINEPLHLIIRDKTGDGAVVEYINGKVRITSGPDVDSVTNGPSYQWQMNNFRRQAKKFKPYNTFRKWDGNYMNGSGLQGLQASYVSPERFVLSKELLNMSPKAYTQNEAFAVAEGLIEKTAGNLGQTPSPTLWRSMADLKNNIYYFKGFLSYAVSGKDGMHAVLANKSGEPGNYQKITLDSLEPSNIPADFFRVRTTRDMPYVNPTSKDVHYSQGVKPRTPYDVEFLEESSFTADLIKKYLFN